MINRSVESTHEKRLVPTAGAPGEARVAIKQILDGWRQETVDTACLLVSELVTNSLRHGHAVLNAAVLLRVVVDRGSLRVEVLDWGLGFDHQTRSTPLDHAGGWGLYLVEELSSRWGIDKGTPNVVWFELPR